VVDTLLFESGMLIFNVLKGAMEGFLGIKKAKVDEQKENNACMEGKKEVIIAASMEDTVDEDLFDNDICFEELAKSENGQTEPGALWPKNLADKDLKADTEITTLAIPQITHKPAKPTTNSPTRPEINPIESQHLSPLDIWADYFASGTQICRELSQPKTPSKSFDNAEQTFPNQTEDLDPKSDDLFDSTKKTSNPKISFSEGVIAHDFAYFKTTSSQRIVLGDPVIPKSPSSFGSLKRKRGYKFPNAIATPSPKTTSNCPSFTAAQISFTADLTKYGISTQVVADVFGEESDTDEDDFSFRAPPAPTSRPVQASLDTDRALMPPPPLRMSPKIFKPPSKEEPLPEEKEGLGIGIYGISTQDIRAIFLNNDGSDTEEDEFGPSLPSPPPKVETKFNNIQRTPAKRKPSPTRLQASPLIRPAAKKPRLVSAPQLQPQLQHTRASPASGSCFRPKAAALTRSFSGPPFHSPPAPMNDLHRFGISTQILNDFVEEDIELSPVDTKERRECGKADSVGGKEARLGESLGEQSVGLGEERASSRSREFDEKWI
jgi:hypothetical protein